MLFLNEHHPRKIVKADLKMADEAVEKTEEEKDTQKTDKSKMENLVR